MAALVATHPSCRCLAVLQQLIWFCIAPLLAARTSCGHLADPDPPPACPCFYLVFVNLFLISPGVRIGLFTPDRAFDMVTKQQINKLKEPSLKLVDTVTIEMLNMCREVASKVRQLQPASRGPSMDTLSYTRVLGHTHSSNSGSLEQGPQVSGALCRVALPNSQGLNYSVRKLTLT